MPEPRKHHHRGEMEAQGMDLSQGLEFPQCAGVIHTDFEKGFIRVEVSPSSTVTHQYGLRLNSAEAGKLGIEGKEYVVQDGDIMHFRFNV